MKWISRKLAAVMALGLLPLAGCAHPYGYGPDYASGPYTAYDSDYDQGYGGYDQPAPYYGPSGGQPGYAPSASGYGPGSGAYGGYGPGYSGQGYYSQGYYDRSYYGQSTYDRSYGPTYRPSGYASSYYNPPPLPPPGYGQPSSYYSTYYGCSCRR